MTNKCLCCGRNLDTRMGYCFDCVESESIIVEGVDMYDKEIPQKEGMTKGMSKLQHILRRYIQISDDNSSDISKPPPPPPPKDRLIKEGQEPPKPKGDKK